MKPRHLAFVGQPATNVCLSGCRTRSSDPGIRVLNFQVGLLPLWLSLHLLCTWLSSREIKEIYPNAFIILMCVYCVHVCNIYVWLLCMSVHMCVCLCHSAHGEVRGQPWLLGLSFHLFETGFIVASLQQMPG